jgi:hypothetical protein
MTPFLRQERWGIGAGNRGLIKVAAGWQSEWDRHEALRPAGRSRDPGRHRTTPAPVHCRFSAARSTASRPLSEIEPDASQDPTHSDLGENKEREGPV